MRRSFGIFVLAAAAVLLAANANAASIGLCDAFAKAVAKRAEENKKNQCGFSDAQNYNHPEAQKRWCRSVKDEETVVSESLRRDLETSRCADCRAYSNEANAAAHDNAMFHCGFSGDRWGSGEGHFSYCMNAVDCSTTWPWPTMCLSWLPLKAKYIDPETNARREQIKQCKAKYTQSQIDRCNQYADDTVKQANFNAASKLCNFPSDRGRYSTNRDEHFAYCTWGWHHDIDGRNIVDVMDEETRIREAELKKCTLLLVLPQKPTKKLGKVKPGQGFAGPSGNQSGTPPGKKSLQKPVGGGSNTAMDRLGGDSQVQPGSGSRAGGGDQSSRSGVRATTSPAGPATGGGFYSTGTGGASGTFTNQKPASQGGFTQPK